MKKILSTVMLVAVAVFAVKAIAAGPWARMDQNIKLPTQSVFDHSQKLAPTSSNSAYLKSGAAISSSGGATIISTFSAQPDHTRNITLTPTGTTASESAGTAVVTGTNIFGKTISENFTIASLQSSATTGVKAFKTVTSVSFPQASSTGLTLSIGIGNKLGLPHCLDDAGKLVFSELGGVYDVTRGTVAADATHVESNTFTPNGTMNAVSNVDMYYIQNYRCFGN